MKRADADIKNVWNTQDLYSSDEEWEKAYEGLTKKADFGKYAGMLGDRKTLLEFLRRNDEYLIDLERLAVYAHLRCDEDTRKPKYNSYNGKVSMLFSVYCSQTAFYEPEMAALDESYLKELLSDKDFSDYDYRISRLIKGKSHVVSEAEEKIIAYAGETLDSFYNIFSMIDNADLPLPYIKIDGKRQKLSHGLYGVCLHSADRNVRKEAYVKYYATYIKLLNTITANYYGNVKKDVFLSKVYKFGSCLEHALFSEDVDGKVYDNLLESVNENLSSMHRYVSDRKKLLWYDKMYFYDVYAPLVSDVEIKLSFDEAYDYVIKGLSPLGKEYQALLKRGRDERWIDVEETEGKRSGAYSSGAYGVHPYVLLNYKSELSDIFTIAHEMGHSLHTYFSQKNQPYAKSEYKIFVAEVASTVNEVLLLKYMLKEATDENIRKYLINYYLDSIRATLHRQTMFAEFEYEAHSKVESGEPLTRENLCALYADLGKKYYGNDIVHDKEISCEWCRIPHFYTSFYVYKYATGIIAAINIVNKILNEGETAVRNYFKFLSSGSSSDPVSLLKLAGVDLNSKEPFVFAMKEFDDYLTEFENLMRI